MGAGATFRTRAFGRLSTRAVVTWLAFSLCVGPFVFADEALAACGTANSGWTEVGITFEDGPAEIVSYSMSRSDPNRGYVTNGTEIRVTSDRFCHTKKVLTSDDVPLRAETVPDPVPLPTPVPIPTSPVSDPTGATARFVEVVTSPIAPDRVYALAIEEGPTGVKPHVLESISGGSDWTPRDRGLELATGQPLDLEIGLGDAGRAYLIADGKVAGSGTPLKRARSLYALSGGGWQERYRFGTTPVAAGETEVTSIAVDPGAPESLWLYGPGGVWRSQDGGVRVEEPLTLRGQPVNDIDIYHPVGEEARIIVLPTGPSIITSDDNGETWGGASGLRAPGDSIATADRPYEIAVATTDGSITYQLPEEVTPRDLSVKGVSLVDVHMAVTAGDWTVFARSTTSIFHRPAPEYVPPKPKTPTKPKKEPKIDLDFDAELAELESPALYCPDSVEILAGESKKVTCHLLKPAVRQLDVYYLIDVSGSMEKEIDGLKRALAEITDGLLNNNIEAHFGAGMYRSYVDMPYRRLCPIGTPLETLDECLEDMRASGGSIDLTRPKSHLAALFQSATGKGQLGLPVGTAEIEPGGEAGFREGVPRIIVNATDEAFVHADPNPTMDEVVRALRDEAILQVGLAFEGDEDVLGNLEVSPKEDLKKVASRTAATAREALDCNGDKIDDLAAGDPLVCVLDAEKSDQAKVISDPIVSLVNAIVDERDVALTATPSTNVVGTVDPSIIESVDFKVERVMDFEITYTCPSALVDSSGAVALEAFADGVPMADGAMVVTCSMLPDAPKDKGKKPPREVPPFFNTLTTMFAPLGVAIAPAVPQTVELANTPNTQAQQQAQNQAQQQAQMQAQGALAPEKQEQVQFAYAYVNPAGASQAETSQASSSGGKGKVNEHWMTSFTEPTDEPLIAPHAVMVVVASMMSGAFGVLARRRRTQQSTVHSTRKRGF